MYYEELQSSEQYNTEGFFDILLYEFDINIEELQDIERVKSFEMRYFIREVTRLRKRMCC